MSLSSIFEIKRGDILLAHPLISDDDFNKTVIIIADNQDESVTGFALNKLSSFTLKDALGDDWPTFPILIGGPVERDALFFIHTCAHLIPDSEHIINDIHWCGDFEIMKNLVLTKQINSTEISFFIGYSGWSLSQIKEEIHEESWAVIKESGPTSISFNADLYNSLKAYSPESFRIWDNTPDKIELN